MSSRMASVSEIPQHLQWAVLLWDPQFPYEALPLSSSDVHFVVKFSIKDESGVKQFWRKEALKSQPRGEDKLFF